jgi:hypothetical protein
MVVSLGFVAATFLTGIPRSEAFVYWANFNNSTGTTVGRSNLDGTAVTPSFIGGADGPCGVATGSTHV